MCSSDLLNQVGVTLAHIKPGVIVRASEDHGQECFLLGHLLIHIHAVKEMRNSVVGQDFAVKIVYSKIHGCLAA